MIERNAESRAAVSPKSAGTSHDEPPVLVESRGSVTIVRLNRPARLNAVNPTLRAALIETLERLNREASVRAVVLAGAGGRAFCAGQDLDDTAALDWRQLPGWVEAQHAMYRAVRALDKPCLAALNGVAAGAGFQIALCADLRIAAPSTRLGQPEVKAGLASIVGSYLMSLHLGAGHNAELSLSGELIDGRRGYEIGLVNVLVEEDSPEAVLDEALARAERMAVLPPTALRLSKQRLRALTQAGFEEACVAGIRAQLECYASGEAQQAMAAFLAKRGGASKG